ncbi:MAG: Crp/Fnr family transcriptional regulator [Methanomicrobiales archaeon]|nr:Crp/Fnr family transcriptional regulator [Methanomicrobiales archaeon]
MTYVQGSQKSERLADLGYTILRNKQDVSRFQIVVEIAKHQPAIRQREIAELLGVTPQSISGYMQDLLAEKHIVAAGRGRYELTREGVEWLLANAEQLEGYARHIRQNIIHQVTIWTALAAENLRQGDSVGVYMKDGLLYAGKNEQSAMGVVISDARAKNDVGVTRLSGIITHSEGAIRVCKIPRVQRGGSRNIKYDVLRTVVEAGDIVGAVGIEASVALGNIDRVPDLYYGSQEGVIEAALHGLSSVIVLTDDTFTDFLKRAEDARLTYEIFDLVVS